LDSRSATALGKYKPRQGKTWGSNTILSQSLCSCCLTSNYGATIFEYLSLSTRIMQPTTFKPAMYKDKDNYQLSASSL